MWKRLIAWLDRDADFQHLASLDDRMLRDIGVPREQLRAQIMGSPSAPGSPQAECRDAETCLLLAARF